jgi:hypothetical protein
MHLSGLTSVGHCASQLPAETKPNSVQINLRGIQLLVALFTNGCTCSFADAGDRPSCDALIAIQLPSIVQSHVCGTLTMYSGQNEYRHRRQRLLWNSESGQRLRIASPTAYLPKRLEVALVALAGGSSSDESRRAAAALHLLTAMLTNLKSIVPSHHCIPMS